MEAKRTRRDARAGQQQAKLYADCLEQQFGQHPVIFYSNGYEHWLWDDASYPPRPVQGFLTKAELELMIQRRTTRLPLAGAEIDPAIVERYYQYSKQSRWSRPPCGPSVRLAQRQTRLSLPLSRRVPGLLASTDIGRQRCFGWVKSEDI